MSIAKLSVDLEARLAGLQAGLDKAGLLAEKQAAAISGAFSKANAAAVTLGATLAGALGAAGITALFRATVDGLDKLNDLAESVGSSVENMSALEDIALRTGTSVDTVGAAIVKMNKALADSSRTKELGAAFQALGLDVEALKRQDPAEAFRQLAIALDGFADDANKARLVQELFGRSLLEVNPLLKDVAAAGKLVGTTTKEAAVAAAQFNDAIGSLQKDALDLARALSGPLIAAINELFGVLKGNGPGALNEYLAVPLQAVTVLGANVAFVLKGIGIEIGGIAAQAAALARLDFQGARNIGELMREDAKAAREEFDKLERRLLSIGAIPQASYSNEGRNYAANKRSLPGSLDGPDEAAARKALAAAKRAADERVNLSEFAAEQLVKLEEITAAETVEAWSYVNDSVMKFDKERTDALKLQWKQVFDFIDQQQEDEIANGQAYLDALKKESSDVGKEIGLVFSSAAGEAIANFKDLRSVLQGILADIAQIAIKKTITEPLSNLIGDSLSGLSLASLFAANGHAFGVGGDVVPFARGGIVDRPTLFKFAKGTGLMGEAGPEAIMPLKRGRDGKLGVAGAGGGVVINQVLNIGAGVSRNEVMAAMQATKQQTLAAIADSRRRGYAMGAAQ